MQKKIISLFFIFNNLFGVFNAQINLVINPSFENHSSCPSNTGGDIDKAIGWDTCRSTADYFNTCASFSFFQIPRNLMGVQYAAHGSAYGGFYTYDASSFYREIIVGSLSTPLIPFQKYFISFKTCRADSNNIVGYSTNNLGAKFSKVKQAYTPINNSAHFYSNTVVTDTINWTKLFGSFVSDSAYQYIMLGNFFDNSNTLVNNHGNGNIAYYYIDEVCVSTDSLYTVNYVTNVNELNMDHFSNLYPNPANNVFYLDYTEEDIKVYNNYGMELKIEPLKANQKTAIDCSLWTNGLYYVKTKNKKYKLIINH